jgi:Skp family chaperone for outer membrane proteins
MRPLIPFLLLYLLAVSPVEAQRGARVGYIDMDIILENISEYKKASLLLDQRIEEWKKEIELKKIELKQLQDQLNAERVLLTPELIADRELEIRDFAGEVVSLQEKRFGPRGDRITQRNLLLKPIQDQVLTVVRTIAREKKYDYIFDRSADIVMLYSSKNYDISDLVLKRINAQQKLKARKEKLKALKEKIEN